jgi:hypothetical protein
MRSSLSPRARLERHFHLDVPLYFILDELPPAQGVKAEVYGAGGRLAARTFASRPEALAWLADEKLARLVDTPCSSDCHEVG